MRSERATLGSILSVTMILVVLAQTIPLMAAQPSVTITPAVAFSGTLVTISGSGFAPLTTVTITYNGVTIGTGTTLTTSASGTFTITINSNDLGPGLYTIIITDGTNAPEATLLIRDSGDNAPKKPPPDPPPPPECAFSISSGGIGVDGNCGPPV